MFSGSVKLEVCRIKASFLHHSEHTGFHQSMATPTAKCRYPLLIVRQARKSKREANYRLPTKQDLSRGHQAKTQQDDSGYERGCLRRALVGQCEREKSRACCEVSRPSSDAFVWSFSFRKATTAGFRKNLRDNDTLGVPFLGSIFYDRFLRASRVSYHRLEL